MKTAYRLFISCICFGLMIGCTDKTIVEDKEPEAVAIQTAPVLQDDFIVTADFGGTLRGDQQTQVISKILGTVSEIPVKIGQRVKEGDILVKFDPNGVQSQFRQTEAQYLNAEKTYRQSKALYDAGAISESEFDAAETAYIVAKAAYDATRQSFNITAPFTGVVADIPIRLGDELSAGIPVVEIADVGALRLVLDVPTSQVAQLETGQPVRVNSPFDTSIAMTGEIISIADAANQATRSFEVECRFTDAPKVFAPGMYVVAEIEVKTLEDATVVSNDAILYRSGKPITYVIIDDAAALIDLIVLASSHGHSAVEGNLQPGQRVVTVGQKNLTPGARVREAGR